MYDLKIDKKLPHHYLIAVAIYPATYKNRAGKMYLKYGPLYFSNDDVERVRSALILSNDKLFKTSQEQALKNFNCSDIVCSVHGINLARSANMCSLHHFSSSFEIEDEWFANLVDAANKSEYNKELLDKSRMR